MVQKNGLRTSASVLAMAPRQDPAANALATAEWCPFCLAGTVHLKRLTAALGKGVMIKERRRVPGISEHVQGRGWTPRRTYKRQYHVRHAFMAPAAAIGAHHARLHASRPGSVLQQKRRSLAENDEENDAFAACAVDVEEEQRALHPCFQSQVNTGVSCSTCAQVCAQAPRVGFGGELMVGMEG